MSTTGGEARHEEEKQKKTRVHTKVQSLGVLLPKAGFEYDAMLPPFAATKYRGYVVVAMKEEKLCKTHIVPKFVDELISDVFKAACRFAHTISGHGIDKFWQIVYHHVDWAKKHDLINSEIVRELAEYMIEARLRFKKSGASVNPGYLGHAARTLDCYIDQLADLSLHQHIPILDEEDELGDGEDEEDLDEEDLAVFQETTAAELAVICEQTGHYDKYFGAGPYIPAWDEDYDYVTFPEKDEKEVILKRKAEADAELASQEFMEVDHRTPEDYRVIVKKQRLGESSSATNVSSEQHQDQTIHKSQPKLDKAVAELIANMRSLGMGPHKND